MSQRERLLRLLSDGRFHSGAALGEALGMGRSAVWKHVRGIEELGVDVFAVPGRGYRLAKPLELLNLHELRRSLAGHPGLDTAGIEVHFEIDSTNRYLMDGAAGGERRPWLCFAEVQTAGRGRRGRQWISPFGRNLYFSLLWRFDMGADALGGLSLVAGAVIAAALNEMEVKDIGLKWPNDLFHRGRKLGGILIELSGEASGPWDAVIGVGINLDMSGIEPGEVDPPWTDLRTAAGRQLGRNRVAASVVNGLLASLPRFEREGFAPFREVWTSFDITLNRTVFLHLSPDQIETGEARGVNDHGALLFQTSGGMRAVTTGDISLRLAAHDVAC